MGRRKENKRQSSINTDMMHNPNNSMSMDPYVDPRFIEEPLRQPPQYNNSMFYPNTPPQVLEQSCLAQQYAYPGRTDVDTEDEYIDAVFTMHGKIKNIITIHKDSSYTTNNTIEYPSIRIKINKIKKLVVNNISYNLWTVKEIDADISSDDIAIDDKLKRFILDSLYYDTSRSKLCSTLSSRQLKLLGGTKEEQIKILKEVFKNYDVDNINIKDIVSIEPYDTDNNMRLSSYTKYKMSVNIGVGKKRVLIDLIVIVSSPVIMLNVLDNERKVLPIEIYRIILEKLSKQ